MLLTRNGYRFAGRKGWIAISGDKRLESVPANRQAVIEAKAKIFVLTDSGSKPEIWGAAIIIGHYRIAEVIDGNEGPFYVSVGKRSDAHISRPKLPAGYDPPQLVEPDGLATDVSPAFELTSAEQSIDE